MYHYNRRVITHDHTLVSQKSMVRVSLPSYYWNGLYALWRHYFFYICEAMYLDRYVPISPILLSTVVEYVVIPSFMTFLPLFCILGLFQGAWLLKYLFNTTLCFLQLHIYVRFFYLRTTPLLLKVAHYGIIFANFLRWTEIWTTDFPEMIEQTILAYSFCDLVLSFYMLPKIADSWEQFLWFHTNRVAYESIFNKKKSSKYFETPNQALYYGRI